MYKLEKEKAAVVDVDPMVKRTELSRIDDFGRKHPLCSGIFRTYFTEQLGDTQIPQSELGRPGWLRRIRGVHFVSREEREYVAGMYVLVNELVEMDEVHRLQKTASDWDYPGPAVKPVHREEISE